MPQKDHYVIIGNGPAGNHAAQTLREKDKKARITIISDECVPYYYKPRLTEFLSGVLEKEKLMVTSLEAYEKNNIRVRLGQTVLKIDPEAKIVFLDHMEKIHYTKLMIASGSRGRILPSQEPYKDHLKLVTSYSDVMEYKAQINAANDMFIIGGDLVGFRFLRMLRTIGKNVTVLIYPNAFWPYNLTRDMLEKITDRLSKYTSDILVKDDISNIEVNKKNRSYKVITHKGVTIDADMVFSFNGLIPNIDFAYGTGIDIDHGILVDENLKTNIDSIYACGSCAQIYNPDIKRYSVTIGWPNAAVQGEVAALNLLGDHKVIQSAGRKYFDLEGVMIKTTWWEDIDDEP